MIQRTPTIGLVGVGGVTLHAFLVPGMETANDNLFQPSKLAEVNVQRHFEGFLSDGPESQSRPVQTVRGIERLVTSTSIEDVDRSSGIYHGIRWWVPQTIKFQ